MKQEYEVTNGKYKGMKTKAATKEQAVKNLKQQLRYKLTKLTDVEKDVIFVAMDLEHFELALQHAGIKWIDFIEEVERLEN